MKKTVSTNSIITHDLILGFLGSTDASKEGRRTASPIFQSFSSPSREGCGFYPIRLAKISSNHRKQVIRAFVRYRIADVIRYSQFVSSLSYTIRRIQVAGYWRCLFPFDRRQTIKLIIIRRVATTRSFRKASDEQATA